MKKLFFLIIGIFLTAQTIVCAVHYKLNLPLEGDSIANDKLQFNTANKIYSLISKKYPSCTIFSISDTQVVHYPYDTQTKNGKYIKGYWKELWTCNACDKKIQIPITFHIKNKKTIFIIENENDLKK